jgi:hypothetical protein
MNVLPNIPQCVEAIMDTPEHIHNLCIAIPEGTKGMVWFKQNKCYILTLSKDKRTFDSVSVDESVIYFPNQETLLYGTFYFINNFEQFYFTVEDIFTYKNTNVSSYPIDVKINIWKYILDNETTPFYTETSPFIIGIPFMTKCWKEMCEILPHISYKIYSVRFHFEDEVMIEKMITTVSRIHYYYLFSQNHSTPIVPEKVQQTNTFLVQADTTIDIYYLYTMSSQEYVGIACVQTLATSTYLNTIFRNIKEDMNIDVLEESDDEDNYHMVVDTTKRVAMECVYNTRFKKWTPVKLTQ